MAFSSNKAVAAAAAEEKQNNNPKPASSDIVVAYTVAHNDYLQIYLFLHGNCMQLK
jgi:hypothetical protein